MNQDKKNVLFLQKTYLELIKIGLGSAMAARSMYENFPHNKTTGWIKDEYEIPQAAFCGSYVFFFAEKTVYKKVEDET